MIILDRTYRKEPIPGVRTVIEKQVRQRVAKITNGRDSPRYSKDQCKSILDTLSDWTADQVYALSPFLDILNRYPGPTEYKKLYFYEKELHTCMTNQKQLNAWANAIIDQIANELWPKAQREWS